VKKSVAGIAVKDDMFFIAKRVSGGELGEKWEFPGGKVENEETDEAALIREYGEEFGVRIKAEGFLGSAEFEHKGKQCVVNAYRISFLSSDFILKKHTEWQWAYLDDIITINVAGGFAESDAKLLPFLKNC
jgi:8-oxo-dGTP diphosphatase